MQKKMLTAQQVAEILQMKLEWVYKHIQALPLKGRLKRYDPDFIEKLVARPCSLTTERKAKTPGRKSPKEDLWS